MTRSSLDFILASLKSGFRLQEAFQKPNSKRCLVISDFKDRIEYIITTDPELQKLTTKQEEKKTENSYKASQNSSSQLMGVLRKNISKDMYISMCFLSVFLADGWGLWLTSIFSLCRHHSRPPSSLPCSQSGATLGILDAPHDANASTCGCSGSPEHHGSHIPGDSNGCWRGWEAAWAQLILRSRPRARGGTRGGERHRNGGGESSPSSVLLTVQSGRQFCITVRSPQQW